MKRIFWFALVTTVLIVSLAVPRSVLSQETTYPTTITDLGTGDYSAAADVNESGQVVGWYYPHDYESNHGFFGPSLVGRLTSVLEPLMELMILVK